MKTLKQIVSEEISNSFSNSITHEEIFERLEIPMLEYGDIAFPFFRYVSTVGMSPPKAAALIRENLSEDGKTLIEDINHVSGFINFKFSREHSNRNTLVRILTHSVADYMQIPPGAKLLIEHTSVNPNKPWHVGHARNAVLGDTLGRVFRKAGYNVEIQNYIDDTGKQVADTMYALEYYGVQIPDEEKVDHFLGKIYADIHAITSRRESVEKALFDLAQSDAATEELAPLQTELKKIFAIEKEIERVSHDLEEGHYRNIIERCVSSQLETAFRLGIFYDVLTWESDIVQSKLFEESMQRIQESPYVYYAQEGNLKGCLILDMEQIDNKASGESESKHEYNKVLIRSNGIPTYAAKDIAFQMWKFGLLDRDMAYRPFVTQPNGVVLETSHPKGTQKGKFAAADKVINVIGIEQAYEQNIVYTSMKIIGFEKEYENSVHLGYEHVWLKEGKMSGRKGVTLSTDEVIDQLKESVYSTTKDRRPDFEEEELNDLSNRMAINVMRYTMLQQYPDKKVVFDLDEVLNVDNDTAPYLMYTKVRSQNVLKKVGMETDLDVDYGLLIDETEILLIRKLDEYGMVLQKTVEFTNPSILAAYSHSLATKFNSFYSRVNVNRSQLALKKARVALVASVDKVLEECFDMFGFHSVEKL